MKQCGESRKNTKTGTEISTLLNADQLAWSGYYMSAIIHLIELLVANQLPLRGDNAGFSSMLDDGSVGLFLSLFEYTLRKDKCGLHQPRNTK